MSDESKPSASKGRLLVVDDDIIIQMTLTDVLEGAGYEVATASDGNGAIEALESSRYDLVLMDCMMPNMDGFEAARAIRSGQTKVVDCRVPIIALTGMDTEEDMQACLEAGMNARVNKPPASEELIAAIDAWLQGDESTGGQAPSGSDTARVEFTDRLADRFMEEIPHTIERLDEATDAEDIEALLFLGHQLSGSAGAIGARELSRCAGAVEDAARTGDRNRTLDEARRLMAELKKLAESVDED